MAGWISALNTARSALRSLGVRMETLSHNIANVDTPGYSRQVATLAENGPYLDTVVAGPGEHGTWIGAGVRVAAINRVRDVYLDYQIRDRYDAHARQAELSRAYENIDRILGEPDGGGLGQRVSEFFSAFNAAANQPQSLGARQLLQDSARALVDQFRSLSGQVTSERISLNRDVIATVDEINARTELVAALNEKIRHGMATGNAPNDLMDERDRILDELTQFAGVNTVLTDDGAATVTIGGKPLVLESEQYKLGTVLAGSFMNVRYLPDNSVVTASGGKLSGLLAARDSVLPPILADLDAIANTIVSEVNNKHRFGYGMLDQPGITWTPGVPAAFANVTLGPNPPLRAGTWTIQTQANGTVIANFTPSGGAPEPGVVGTITAGGTNTTLIPGLVLTAPAVLINDTDTVSVNAPARNFFNPLFTTASTISLDGTVNTDARQIALSAAANSPADGVVGQQISDLARAFTMTGATQTFGEYWRGKVSVLGAAARANETKLRTNEAMVEQMEARRDAISAVSLEEEGVDLIRIQRAYQAAAQVITTQNEMIGTLIGALTR